MITEIRACIARLKIIEQKVEHAFAEYDKLKDEYDKLKKELENVKCKTDSQEPTQEIPNSGT